MRRHNNFLAIPQARRTGRRLTLADTHVRGASSTDPSDDGGITGVPTPSHPKQKDVARSVGVCRTSDSNASLL
nr:MAG TPA: hypothetical protein [Caudoviricetes sp.]